MESELPRPLKSAILKGRNNFLCLNKISGPGDEAIPEAGEDSLIDTAQISATGAQVARIHEWAQETEDGDRDNLDRGVSDIAWRQVSVTSRECIGATQCPYGDRCFAELAKLKAAEADIVVTNHSLLAIDALTDAAILPEHDAVIIDEAHELESRITSAATEELSATAIAILAKRAGKFGPDGTGKELTEALDEWIKAVDAALATTDIRGRWTQVPAGLDVPLTVLKDAAWSTHMKVKGVPAGEFANDPAKAAERQSLVSATEELHDTCVRVLAASTAGGGHDGGSGGSGGSGSSAGSTNTVGDDLLGEDVVWLTSHNNRNTVHVAPLSVADLLRQRLFSRSAVILTSATLALGGRFDAMLSQWGASSTTKTLDVGTPFDAKTHGILYIATDLPNPGRTGPSDELVDHTAQLINAAGGRTLGLFSSRRAAEEMADQLRTVVPYPILLQGEDSMSSLVEKFRKDESACLFGTLGLWQGVDVPGPSLSLVIMDRIPFPRPDDPLAKARTEAANNAGRRGFMEVSATHAALLMAQGAGRLLRSVDDRGVVAVLDPRLATARYAGFIRASMPKFWETTKLSVAKGALRRLTNDVAGSKQS